LFSPCLSHGPRSAQCLSSHVPLFLHLSFHILLVTSCSPPKSKYAPCPNWQTMRAIPMPHAQYHIPTAAP
jgi:hypothetical protein